MLRQPIITKDGSHTLFVPGMNVTYHSLHGAIQESMHVFIHAGLIHLFEQVSPSPLRILEMGLGTGLNALLTFEEAEKRQKPVHYTAFEAFPLQPEEALTLNYCDEMNRQYLRPVFKQLHFADWGKEQVLSSCFTFTKINASLISLSADVLADLIYYDAFAPGAQPELWTKEIFDKIFSRTRPGGILVTYCSKGDVRRALLAAGYIVEKIPGPPGKREMLRAKKSVD